MSLTITAFAQLCSTTEKATKNKHLIKDAFWKCSVCQNELPWTAYFVNTDHKQWGVQYEERICHPGALRKCLHCNPMTDDEAGPSNEQPRCTLCQVTLLQEAVPKVMWKQRNTRNTRCHDCRRPKCTGIHCQTCKICRDETCESQTCTKPITSLHHEWLPKTLEERDSWLCSKCRTHRCSLCEELLPQTAFPHEMWKHRFSRNAFCNDCCRPKCTWKNCKTCTNCRQEDCDKKKEVSSDNNEFASNTNPTQSRRTQHLAMFKMSLHCVSNMQEERMAKKTSSKASGIRIKSSCGRVEIASLWKNQRKY